MTARGSRVADVRIDGERITHVGHVPDADHDVDASGLFVLPGCVDLHTHLASTATWTPLDDFEHGGRAAIAGGVTTVVSMVFQEQGSLRRGVERAQRDAERSVADYAFHIVVTDPSESARKELPGLVRDGHAGLKVFMVAKPFVERTADYLELYRAAARHGMVVAVHAEDQWIIERRTTELHRAGQTAARYFPESRPVEAEVAAVGAAVRNATETGAATYLVHLSSAAALAQLRSAKADRRATIFGETRPLYLYLTRERFERDDGALWVGQPPLRDASDVTAVWRALTDGTCDTVGTDHVPYRRAQKLADGLTFDKIPPGVANLETLLPMLYSEGVRRNRISLERMVDVLATTPARIGGLRAKGEIAVGKDADLVLFDPERTRTIVSTEMHSASDYDPYEGWSVTGWPRAVYLRGKLAYDGEVRVRPGAGRFTARAARS